MKKIDSKITLTLTLVIVYISIVATFNAKIVETETPPNTRTIVVPDDYPSIQVAIREAKDGGHIYVRAGEYPENLVIDKSICLFGEDKRSIIRGQIKFHAGMIYFSGFSVIGDGKEGTGISFNGYGKSNIFLCENIIANFYFGLSFYDTGNHKIFRNEIVNNTYGIYFCGGVHDNIFSRNVIFNNSVGARINWPAENNEFHHNLFINNSIQIEISDYGASGDIFIRWDNGYPSGGNYWSDYDGKDKYKGPSQNEMGSDGIGDKPYIIDERYNYRDNYPFITPDSIPQDDDPPKISISSPENDKVYETSIIPLTFTANEPLLWMGYSLDGGENVTILGNTTLYLTRGTHRLVVYTRDLCNNVGKSEEISFLINATMVEGCICEDTIWTLENSPYVIVKDVIVKHDATLTIEKGVVVKFANATSLIINGTLIAKGNALNPIEFTSDWKIPGSWKGILFDTLSNKCEISYAIIEHGTQGIQVLQGSPIIMKCFISNNKIGVYLSGRYSSAIIIGNKIENNTIGGMVCKDAGLHETIQVSENIFSSNSIFCQRSCISFSKNTISGIRLEACNAIISLNHIDNLAISGGNVTINFNHIFGNLAWYGSDDLNATYNWWDTTNEIKIIDSIHDYYDDPNLGKVLYKPYLFPPVANFTFFPKPAYACGVVTFDASASFNIYGSIINYTWNFGDGNITTTIFPFITHRYEKPGIYNIILTVVDEFKLENNVTKSLVVITDNISPTTFDDYNGEWRNGEIMLRAIDNESGVAETFYRINNGSIKTVSTDGHPLITTEGSNNTLEYWSVDNAGNEEPHRILTGIKIDKTSPLSSITKSGDVGENGWFVSNVTVIITASDNLSGISRIEYSFDNITYLNYTAPLITSSEGYLTLYYRAIDNAGNIENVKVETLKVDIAPPIIQLLHPSAGEQIKSSAIDVSWSGLDEASGISHYEISLDDGSWINVGAEASHTFAGLADGEHKVTIKAVDKAGNVKEESVEFIVNTSLIGSPGWTDDTIVFSAIAAIIIGLIAYLTKRH